MQNLIFNVALSFWIGVILVIVAIFLWFIVRQKYQQVWLPTIKILDIKQTQQITFKIIFPPLFTFIIFFFLCLTFLFFLLQPTQKVEEVKQNKSSNIYVILDLSPSVSARISESSYQDLVVQYWDKVFESSQVMIATTAQRKFIPIHNKDELIVFLKGNLHFHSYGARLDLVAQEALTNNEADKIFIFADADKHSWLNFNWRYYQNVSKVFWVQIGSLQTLNNIFINNVKFSTQLSSQLEEWEVEISRNFISKQTEGKLEVILNNQSILEKQWAIPPKSRSIKFNVSFNPNIDTVSKDNVIIFKIYPKNNDDDYIKIDNIYREFLNNKLKKVVLIGEGLTEVNAEDPTLYLIKILELLGLDVTHYPNAESVYSLDLNKISLMILFFNYTDKLESFCPLKLSQKLSNIKLSTPILIWLASQSSIVNYISLCECLMYLNNDKNSAFLCQNLFNREDFVTFLDKIGAKQLGGEIAELSQAIAFTMRDKNQNFEFYIFNIPLKPSKVFGLTHGKFPLILKFLLQRKNLIPSQNFHEESFRWPKLEDLYFYEKLPTLIKQQVSSELSNVPTQESLLISMDESHFPKKFSIADLNVNNVVSEMVSYEYKHDAINIVRFMALVVVFLCLMESLLYFVYMLIKTVRKIFMNKSVLLFMLLFISENLFSQVHIVVIRDSNFYGTAKNLSYEVIQRTSIEMSDKIYVINDFKAIWENEPWLWLRSLKFIKDHKTNLLSLEVIQWLKKGGFLIIENYSSFDELKNLTRALEEELQTDLRDGEWGAIPPDHELMRSFHLLSALPICDDKNWMGFHFDKRLAILAIPYNFLDYLLDKPITMKCQAKLNKEFLVRTFINILMVVLTTDYKKDQIHIPEILKRLK